LRTASATAAIALIGVSAFVLIQGIHLQDWGLARWGQQSSVAQRTQQRLRVDSLDDLRKLALFDATGKEAKVFYSIDPSGEVELFSAAGRNPESGEYLKPITPAVVQQIERRLRQKEQDRLAEAERKAATARADAEIARARRVQSASIPQKREAQVVETTSPPRSLPSPTPRASPAPRVEPTPDPETIRTTEYNELVSAARALIDAGRYGEARMKAQRAIYVDPRRLSARALWAEAQTRLDQTSASAYPSRRSRWPY
jgi:hypothetical protein